MKLYYLKREKGRNEILETNISDRLYHSDNFAALLERICQQFPCVSVGYPASGADYDSRKPDSHDDDLYGDVSHCFFIPNCDILSAGNAIRDAGTACDARSILLTQLIRCIFEVLNKSGSCLTCKVLQY